VCSGPHQGLELIKFALLVDSQLILGREKTS
jgi:hypothetical protein